MRKRLFILIPGALLGIVLALSYINPYTGTISLSELVLQLSGSRGEFALNPSLNELLAFTLRLIPTFLFEALVGTAFYQYYCTASVYIFSRIPNRLQWYGREVLKIGGLAILYQLVLMGGAVLMTLLRYQIVFDWAGTLLVGYHFSLYVLWILAITLLVNLIAIKKGSSTAFLILACVQVILVSLLKLLDTFQGNAVFVVAWLRANPMAHLVLSWQHSCVEALDVALAPAYSGVYLEDSLLMMGILCVVVILVGAEVVWRHDLLAANAESGGN